MSLYGVYTMYFVLPTSTPCSHGRDMAPDSPQMQLNLAPRQREAEATPGFHSFSVRALNYRTLR